MRHDWRTLSRDNIIISYSHANKDTDEAACESVVREREREEESRKSKRACAKPRRVTMNCGGPLFVCQTIGGSIRLRWKQRATIDRSFGDRVERGWRYVDENPYYRTGPIVLYMVNDQNRIALIEWKYLFLDYILRKISTREGKKISKLSSSMKPFIA